MKPAYIISFILLLVACQTPEGAARRELDMHWKIVDQFLAWEYANNPGGRATELAEQIREEYPTLWEDAARLTKDQSQRIRYELLLLRLRTITAEIAAIWKP